MSKYRIMRLRYTDNNIYLDLYNDDTMSNIELQYCHYHGISKYKDIKNYLSMCQHQHIRIDIHELIEKFETRRKKINNEHM